MRIGRFRDRGEPADHPSRRGRRRIVCTCRFPERQALHFGPGYLTESPRHPLHTALYRKELDETKGLRCAGARSLAGRVEFTPGFGMVIRSKGLDDPSSALLRPYDGVVFVDAGTEFDGLDRAGIPYLEKGTEVSVEAQPCEGGGGSRKLVVTRMTVAP